MKRIQMTALALLAAGLAACSKEAAEKPATGAALDVQAEDLDLRTQAEIDAQVAEDITEENADEELKKLVDEIGNEN